MQRNALLIIIGILLIILALILFPRTAIENSTVKPSPTVTEVEDVQPTERPDPTEIEEPTTQPTTVPTVDEITPTTTTSP